MALQGLPPRERLRGSERLDELFRCGRVAKSGCILARGLPNGLPFSRVAMAVGKAAGNAVVRNRIRRRLRAAYRLAKGALPAGWDWALVARPGAVAAAFPALVADVKQAVERAVSGERQGAGRSKER